MNPVGTPPTTDREERLANELREVYESLADITSRLLLVNEASEAALSTHDRTGLGTRCLEMCSRGAGVRRATLFLVDGDGISIGATSGLSEDEEAELPESVADVDACHAAMESRRLLVLDPERVADETVGQSEDSAEHEVESEDGDGRGIDEDEEEEEGEGVGAVDGDASIDGDEDAEPSCSGAYFDLYLPAFLEGEPVAVLGFGERGGGRPFDEDDVVLLRHVLRQFAAALSRSRLIEQNEVRLAELDALLKVSREITSTLDLDAVLRAVVNTVGAVVPNDRAEIALLKGGSMGLRAVSGYTRLDVDQSTVFKLDRPLEYLTLDPRRVQIAASDLQGDDDVAGRDVFAEYFSQQDMHAFMAVPLKDDQGLLGCLCIESRQDAWEIEPSEGDTLDIVAAQTSVAIRNAQLYSNVPLRGVSRPLSQARTRLQAWSRNQRLAAVALAAALGLVLLFPVLPERSGGEATIRPLRFGGVHAMSEGVVRRVFVTGGDEVRAGQPLAEIEDLDLAGRVAQLRGDIDVARRDVAAARERGDDAAWRTGQIRLAALERTLAYEEQRVRGATLTSPNAGQVLELNLATRVGQHLEAGERFCTVAALDPVAAEIEISEVKIGRVTPGRPVVLKVQAYPGQTFRGRVTEVGWAGRLDAKGSSRFTVRAEIANQGRRLRPGMTGIGKVDLGRRPLAAVWLEPLARAIQLKLW